MPSSERSRGVHYRVKVNRRAFALASLWPSMLLGLPQSGRYEAAGSSRKPAVPPRADLPNHFDEFLWMSKQRPTSYSFLKSSFTDLENWKVQARSKFIECLSYDIPAGKVTGECSSVIERDGLVIEQLYINSNAPYPIPATLLLPASRRGKIPGIIAAHCHSGRYVWGREKIISAENEDKSLRKFRDEAYGRPYAEELAKRGYAVLVIDAFYFGERRLAVEQLANQDGYVVYSAQPLLKTLRDQPVGSAAWLRTVDRICGIYEELTAKTLLSAGATWPGLLVWDDRRAVDYICSRPEVDSSRIGALGLSIGGLRTGHLIAADPRVKVACVVGWMTEFQSQLRNHLRSHTWMAYVPGLYGWLDLPDAAGLIAPGALFVLQCAKDRLFPMSGMTGAVSKLEQIFAKAGIPERFQAHFYEVPHSFTPKMQDDSFEWIEKWI